MVSLHASRIGSLSLANILRSLKLRILIIWIDLYINIPLLTGLRKGDHECIADWLDTLNMKQNDAATLFYLLATGQPCVNVGVV